MREDEVTKREDERNEVTKACRADTRGAPGGSSDVMPRYRSG